MVGSEIYKLAERMEKMTRRELQKFKSAHGLNGLVLPNSVLGRAPAPSRASKRSTNQRTSLDKDDVAGQEPYATEA